MKSVASMQRVHQCTSSRLPTYLVQLQHQRRSPIIAAIPQRKTVISVANLTSQQTSDNGDSHEVQAVSNEESAFDKSIRERKQRRDTDQNTYQWSAIAASLGMISIAVVATYLRFFLHVESDAEMPWADIMGTLTLVAGGAIGMEMYAKWAHKALWHEYAPGWKLHITHHSPRLGLFEDNDIFAVMNALPAMALCAFGFVTPNIWGAGCFGAGLGITLYGIAYMFIHDGMVHKRFPTGPISEWPMLKRMAVAHQLHHSGKYAGAPWGMFLGPQELEAMPGGKEELDRMVADMEGSRKVGLGM